MKSADGKTVSAWYSGLRIPKFPSLNKNAITDVCVVGGGISGLTTAYELARERMNVIVVDEGPIGSGQTGRTSAHLASAFDDRFYELEAEKGKEASRLAYESHAKAIDTIEEIIAREEIDCDFTRLDGLLSSESGEADERLKKEFLAAKRAGAEVQLSDNGGLGDAPCIIFKNQARFHPMRYLVGLAGALVKLGVKIYSGQRVIDVQGADLKKKIPARVNFANETQIECRHVVVATNTPAPINDWFGIYTKQQAYRTYMIGADIPRRSVPDALFWDDADPYHYVRVQKGKGTSDILLIGGEDHKVGQFPEGNPFKKLEDWAKPLFPKMGRIRYRWSGQVQEPVDGLGFIGHALTKNENVFVITGDSGMGLTHGTLGALLVTDQIMGRKNKWEKLYDPSRKVLNSEFLKENANTMAQYKDLLTAGDVKTVQEIPRGEGAIIRKGLSKLAVYRDDEGKLHKHSAVCTHLQCIVRWNKAEKTWDCPCHGSRFDPYGKVIMGPAVDDLPESRGHRHRSA